MVEGRKTETSIEELFNMIIIFISEKPNLFYFNSELHVETST